ncbi:odorant receptor 82a-like isoform X1 [Vespula pensylvanica]|uniref:odorant receptor 82a-like isoform X1 n=1 Tax=Vespula pensylvanica TaxID=30213 RepID=UPI001CBA03F3|nr:odorant receptor 82a-like isoform X1 [Vespula pensylvanica]
METKLEAIDVTEAMKSLLWNKQLLKYVGIWPLEISNALFFFFFFYLILHCSLTFAELTHRKHSLGDVMSIFTENILLLMTLTKITTCWLNRESLGHLLIELDDNFIVHNYNTLEKRFIFMKYTKLAKYYFLIAVTSMSVAVGLYYVNEMIPNVKIAIGNSSTGYKLPYKTRNIVDISDIRVYICLCLYQTLVVPVITLGYVGFDCLFTNLAFHITAQFGILSYTIKEILDDPNDFQCNMKKLVLRHYKLIRQAETLEDNFNVLILQQLMGSTFQLCISGYNTLLDSVKKEGLTVVIFYSYAFCVMSTLFTYCYIGECLIQESSSLSTAFYRYEWYNVSPLNLKMVKICMLRMRKPQQLTSGKFFVLSLASFTDIVNPCISEKQLTDQFHNTYFSRLMSRKNFHFSSTS